MLLTQINTLEQCRDTLKALETLSTDVTIDPREITDVTLGGITVPGLGRLNYAGKAGVQLAERAGIPTSTFKWLSKHHPEKAQQILDQEWAEWLEGLRADQKVLVRAREVNDGLYMRAFLSDRYGIIDSLDIVETLMKMLPDHLGEAKVKGMKPKVWLDTITGAFSFKGVLGEVAYTTGVDRHDWGICGGNDECGGGSSILDALYGRVFCTNQFSGLGIGKKRQSHVIGKDGIEKFREGVGGWLKGRIDTAATSMEPYWNLRGRELTEEKAKEALVEFGSRVGLPKGELVNITTSILPAYVEEVGCTAYAVVNSLTHFARDLEDRAKQQMWEAAAGNMVHLFR